MSDPYSDPLSASTGTDDEDYYTNPMVTNSKKILGNDNLSSMISQLGSPSTNVQQQTADILGIGQSPQTPRSGSSMGNPFYYDGKLVKFARYFISNVEVPQNSSWPGYQDYLEDGALMGFSVTCNDPDMIPVVFVENSAGSKEVINDLSFKEAVIHGRGMTYGEATSTIRTSEGDTSRDVSGQQLTLFPYVSRYKDTFTGTGVYDDIKNTVDDKAYVMKFEPSIFVPYSRLYFDVFNGSSFGTRLINRLEIRRLVYVDQNSATETMNTGSDYTNFNKDLQTLINKMNDTKLSQPSTGIPPITTPVYQSMSARETFMDKLKDDFIHYMWKKMNNENVTEVDLTGKSVHIADMKEQKEVKDMYDMLNGGGGKKIKKKPPSIQRSEQDDVLVIRFEE